MNRQLFPNKYIGILCLVTLAAVICVPVLAAGDVTSVTDNQFPVQQAHLAWMAEKTGVEMVAAIAYVETLPGADTSTMRSLLSDFQNAKSNIGSITSSPDLYNHTLLMQEIAKTFDTATKNQMNLRQGKTGDLQERIGNAVTGNPYIATKKDAYWTTRATNQLDDFDNWVTQTQETLDTLKAQGYPVEDTQPFLYRFVSLKNDLKSSIGSKDFRQADATVFIIGNRSEEISNRIQDLQNQVSEDKKIGFRIDEANRVVARAERINSQLTEQIIYIGSAYPALEKTKKDVKTAQNALNGGQVSLASTYLLLIKEDYRTLAMAYRNIAVSTGLPEGMVDILRAMTINLDDTSDRIGVL